MSNKKHSLKVVAIAIIGLLYLTGCGGSKGATASVFEGTWETTQAALDGSVFSFDELDNMGESSVEETTIVFKEGGKCVVIIPDDNYSSVYDWEKTGENKYVISNDWEEFELTKEDDHLLMKYDDYGTEVVLHFEKTTDEQTVPNLSEEEEKESKESKSETTITEEPTTEYTEEPIDFYTAMDEYEIFIDEYITFMKEYKASDNPSEYMDEYTEYLNQYVETMDAISAIDKDSLSTEELAYYTEVNSRILKKLSENGL